MNGNPIGASGESDLFVWLALIRERPRAASAWKAALGLLRISPSPLSVGARYQLVPADMACHLSQLTAQS
ncbi:hypothetical protein Acsp05_19490 [Actinokineospora sp. NBRC 105648]|nr:hypothetical protein Acsp05_19490 [Actinokineospora sp. NBRC 105648]